MLPCDHGDDRQHHTLETDNQEWYRRQAGHLKKNCVNILKTNIVKMHTKKEMGIPRGI